MKRDYVCLGLLTSALAVAMSAVTAAGQQAPPQGPEIASYASVANKLIDAALGDTVAFTRLGEFVDTFGSRLSGTRSLETAIDWTLEKMKRDGLENVHGETVMVPHWVRGNESAEMIAPRFERLRMLGLGSSIGTPPDGITAPVLIVDSFDDLAKRVEEAKGKIVLFDVPFVSYPETVRYRVTGAVAAAKVGAVASLVRSIASFSIASPHTGNMRYDSTVKRIPSAAISSEDASLLHRIMARGQPPVLRLTMEATTLPDAVSRNVIAELRGREFPEEVVLLGGHIDSWDVGQGAMDDAGGMVAAWEAVRLMKVLGLRPRRTVRVVAWTNEENGGRGNLGYRDSHLAALSRHVLAIESDNGVFRPSGFRFSGSDSGLVVARQVAALLRRIGADTVETERNAPEADIAPLVERGVPGMGLNVDRTRYFWFHHSAGDTLDKLTPQDLSLCIATLAVMAYVVADLPQTLPRQSGR